MNYMHFIRFKTFIRTSLCVAVLASLFTSCDAIFEDDISSDDLELISPADDAVSVVQTQTFEWEELDEANEYRFQLITPTFSNPSDLLLDSTLTGTSIVQSLTPGTYQWRVKGINSSSETAYTIRTLTIENSNGLGNQVVVALSPATNTFTSEETVVFDWVELDQAESYLIRFEEDDEGMPGALLSIEGATSSGVEIALNEGTFWWKVAGEDGSSTNSQYSASRKLVVDRTIPSEPNLSEPGEGEIVFTSSYIFLWDSGSDEHFSHYVFELSSNENFVNIDETQQVVESEALVDFTEFLSGTYYWRIRSLDLAGNENVSQTSSFFLQ